MMFSCILARHQREDNEYVFKKKLIAMRLLLFTAYSTPALSTTTYPASPDTQIVAIILGSVLGIFALITLLVLVLFVYRCRKPQQPAMPARAAPPSYVSQVRRGNVSEGTSSEDAVSGSATPDTVTLATDEPSRSVPIISFYCIFLSEVPFYFYKLLPCEDSY